MKSKIGSSLFARGTALSALVMSAGLHARALPQEQPPNILLVVTDQQVANGYSAAMGDKYIHTPTMDKLATGGRVFVRAYAANPICMPSRTSMWSGRYPHETGIMTNDRKYIDAQYYPTLGTVFSKAGYETAYVGKWHAAYPVHDASKHGFQWTANMEDDGNGLDPETPAAAIRFIRGQHDKPWLLVVSFNDPHNICEWARGQELPDGTVGSPPALEKCPPMVANHEPPENEPDIMALMRRSYHASRMFPVGAFSEKEWREYLWAYYRMIEKVDKQVGVVLAALNTSGQTDNTMVVFISDHGDMLGAHGWNQKTVFFDEAVRVPFFLYWPGHIHPETSTRLVNTGVDLMPTLCDFAGIAVPSGQPGESLKEDDGSRRYIVVENHMVQGAAIDGQKPEPEGRMVRSDRYKYCVYNMGKQCEELYDLEKDPGETVNQAENPNYRSILEQHRSYLKSWCAQHDDVFPVP